MTDHATKRGGYHSNAMHNSNDQKRKRGMQVRAGIGLAFIGAAIFAVGAYFCLLKNPRTNAEDVFGWLNWFVGSWLLGGGITLTFARPAVAALVGFLTPGLTFGMALTAYWGWVVVFSFLH